MPPQDPVPPRQHKPSPAGSASHPASHGAHAPGTAPAGDGRTQPTAADFARVQASPEFAELRKRFRTFAFPLTAAFLIWYFAYVLLSIYAKDLMATPVLGHVNLGVLLGLGQFVTTFLITWLYIRHANKNLDPIAAALRAELEGTTR